MGHKIEYQKVKNKEDAFLKVKEFITPDYLNKFQMKIDLVFDEKKKKVLASGNGFSLTIDFFDTCVEVNLELSLLLRPLKNKILEKIESQITRNL